MLAKKGGLKTALNNPNQFLADYNQKVKKGKGDQQQAEQMNPDLSQTPQEQEVYRLVDIANAAETKAIQTMTYDDLMAAGDASMAVAKAIRAAGMGEDSAKEWDDSAQEWYKQAQQLIPAESHEGQIQIDDPNQPVLPEEPMPISSQPYEEVPPEEADFYTPEDYYSEEITPLPEESQVKAGTEWWYYGAKGQPFPSQQPEEYYYEQDVTQDESIIPQADWYRDIDTLPSPYSEERYYQQDYPYDGYIPEGKEEVIDLSIKEKPKTVQSLPFYQRQKYGGWTKPYGGMQGLGLTKKPYYPESPKPISPYYAKITKTSKYLPDEIVKLPFPLARNVSFRRKVNF